jgi:hypothetical protein
MSRPTSMVLFEMKTFLWSEMKMMTKMPVGLLGFMMGKLRRHLAWFHRCPRARGHNNLILKSGLVRIPTSEMTPLTATKAVLEDITFDRMIHY